VTIFGDMVAGVTLGAASLSVSRSCSGDWGRGDCRCGFSRVDVILKIHNPGAEFTDESLHERYEEVENVYDPGDDLVPSGSGRLDGVS